MTARNLHQFSKLNNFLWVYWFIGKYLSSFLPPAWKLDNLYYHNEKWSVSFLSSFGNISPGHYPSRHPVQWSHSFDKWILTQLIWVFTLHKQCLNRGLKGLWKIRWFCFVSIGKDWGVTVLPKSKNKQTWITMIQ